ncbi:MAG: hypothetical protein OEZ22_06360 [Spirochaetia bacterium]|nr:hypothetical protein [Spirochaetia bacterium]
MKKILLSIILILIIAYCGGESMPLEEMSLAKHKISKAESVKADKYAPGYYRSAIDELKKSHGKVTEDNMAEAKNHALEAQKFADQAFEKAAPALAEATKKEAEAAIQEAEKAFAEEFAAAELENAKKLLAEGDELFGKKDFINAYQKFEASREEAVKARNIAESQAEIMKRNIAEIEDTINEAVKYGAEQSAPDALKNAREKLELAKEAVEGLNLKDAAAYIDEAAASARQALMIGHKDWASKLLIQAEAAIKTAQEKIDKLNKSAEDKKIKKFFETDVEAQAALNSMNETMEAAQNSYDLARQSLENEAYEDSVNQSEEAIRLAKIIEDQIPQLIAMASRGKGSEVQTVPVTTKEGWKTYKVRLIPNKRDCLWRIAEYDFIYDNPLLWPKIYKANKAQIKNPDLIFPGQIFDIPPKDGAAVKPKIMETNEETVGSEQLDVKPPAITEENEEVKTEGAPAEEIKNIEKEEPAIEKPADEQSAEDEPPVEEIINLEVEEPAIELPAEEEQPAEDDSPVEIEQDNSSDNEMNEQLNEEEAPAVE